MIIKLCDVEQLPEEGAMKTFRGDGLEICIARPASPAGALFAFDNGCPHQNAPLSRGGLDGCTVTCPYHGWQFDVSTGAPALAGDPSLTTYEVRQYGDEVFIQLPGPAR